ncbi:hypothetical protein HJC23_008817 [Cyclotella cryptica]|uniref:PDZ domain-containing protein n=1 Tax=Cyclotella cryptica TaxID=29204 RepID=A0ABD3QA35_9STRA|eukprot:CCRYP_007467-RA/>CCRYP_007467-RA protein AED:0.09 eAED:0.09 QI:255/1/1/1/1/1/3/410/365
MPSLLCPLFRSKQNNKNTKKKKKTTTTAKSDRNDANATSLPNKSLVHSGNYPEMSGKRDTNSNGMYHPYNSAGTDRSRSTMDTARLSVLSLETNRRANFRDDDSSSLPTIDPDYNPTNDCFSLSDAGGTIGSQSLAATTAFGSATRASSAAFGTMSGSYLERGLYNDAPYNTLNYPGKPHGVMPPSSSRPHPSLPSTRMPPPSTTQQQHQHQQYHLQHHQQQQQLLEIYAPPGKLGVVIDVPPQATTPLVHAIKDTCPIRNEIFVGDQLLAVDDEDVTSMTAMEVSRLISRKSQQRARKLTIRRGRMGVVGGGMVGGGGVVWFDRMEDLGMLLGGLVMIRDNLVCSISEGMGQGERREGTRFFYR